MNRIRPALPSFSFDFALRHCAKEGLF